MLVLVVLCGALGCGETGRAPADRRPAVAQVEATPSPEVSPPGASFDAQLYAEDVPLGQLPLSVSIETLGGVATVLLPRGCQLPCEHSEVFTTALANQPSVELHVVQGEAELAAHNREIGRMHLSGLPPAPAGVPQIRVSFSVDARGRLRVSAQDLASHAVRPVNVAGPRGEPVTAEQVRQLQVGAPNLAAAPVDPAAAKVSLFEADVATDRLPLSIGVETVRGEVAVLFARGSLMPARRTEIFSTALDNQAQVEVHLIQGERALAVDNRTLGKFVLTGIPPAERGIPQIELTLAVDTNGVLSASAIDLGTRRQQQVEIVAGASAGLSQADVDRMLADAVAARAQDDQLRGRIAALNELDSLIHGARGLLASLRSGGRATTIQALEVALQAAVSVVGVDPREADLAAVAAARSRLEAASHQASRELYATAGPSQVQ
ncbi:Chaperone protein DnaK [Enhygromyxa salina]|uniref:Chaperone protein DnaK n=1 Tax=Enhygromyxa salina TaxID=215803 RepID=A0A2S9YFN6_9BACT|nr:Chaperone protein DnaK [Enhygromyxa salina]